MKSLILPLLLAPSSVLFSQSNTLPSSGAVGIGTVSPEVPLHVFSGDSGGVQHLFSQLTVEDDYHAAVTVMTPSTMIGFFGFGDEDAPLAGGMSYDHRDDRLILTVSEQNYALQINKFGKVGIGGSASEHALEVNGTVALSDGSGFALRKQFGLGSYAIHFAGVGPRHPIRFVGSSDASTHRYFEFGYSENENPADVWHPNIVMNSFTGFVGIRTTSPTHPLSVNGAIRAKEVIVDTNWADHVFDPEYKLAPLREVEQHIAMNRRLPGMPSAEEVAERGVSIGEAQRLLLEKVEELTLHVIEQSKRVEALETENGALKEAMSLLSK